MRCEEVLDEMRGQYETWLRWQGCDRDTAGMRQGCDQGVDSRIAAEALIDAISSMRYARYTSI